MHKSPVSGLEGKLEVLMVYDVVPTPPGPQVATPERQLATPRLSPGSVLPRRSLRFDSPPTPKSATAAKPGMGHDRKATHDAALSLTSCISAKIGTTLKIS